jgi:hypothetical protein
MSNQGNISKFVLAVVVALFIIIVPYIILLNIGIISPWNGISLIILIVIGIATGWAIGK